LKSVICEVVISVSVVAIGVPTDPEPVTAPVSVTGPLGIDAILDRTKALVAASWGLTGSATLVILLLPISIKTPFVNIKLVLPL